MEKTSNEFEAVFGRLRAILRKHVGRLSVKEDTATRYCLEGGLHPRHRKPMPIALVEIGKGYVSYHLMPVYGCPKLLDRHSEKLKARMQGKACFNFKVRDETLFAELEQLTAEAIEAFGRAGFLEKPGEKAKGGGERAKG
jgi:hypothetical protein